MQCACIITYTSMQVVRLLRDLILAAVLVTCSSANSPAPTLALVSANVHSKRIGPSFAPPTRMMPESYAQVLTVCMYIEHYRADVVTEEEGNPDPTNYTHKAQTNKQMQNK